MRILALALLLLCVSCASDSPTAPVAAIDHSGVIGYWELVSASRNGKPTGTLKDAYFNFELPASMQTNLFGNEIPNDYSWQDSTIVIVDSSMMYRVRSLTPDSMELSFDLNRYAFDLSLIRKLGNR